MGGRETQCSASNSLSVSVDSWHVSRSQFSPVQSEASDLDVPVCWRIPWSFPRQICFFVFCPVEGGVCSQTDRPQGSSSSKLDYCGDS